jgi:acetyl-CoA synthetase
VKGESIAVFCVLRRGEADTQELRAAIAAEVVRELGKALKPDVVEILPALPKTRSGKVMRRIIRAAYLGLDPGDLSALDDPGSLEAIRGLAGSRP